MARIAVVGSLNADLLVRVSRHPRPGETLHGSGGEIAPGGDGPGLGAKTDQQVLDPGSQGEGQQQKEGEPKEEPGRGEGAHGVSVWKR